MFKHNLSSPKLPDNSAHFIPNSTTATRAQILLRLLNVKMDQQKSRDFANLRFTEDGSSTLNPINEREKIPGRLSADGAQDQVDSFANHDVSYSLKKNPIKSVPAD